MDTVFPLLLVTFFANAIIGIVAIQKLYYEGAGLIDRVSTALLVLASMFVLGSGMTTFYLWLPYGHWPEACVGLAILLRLCLKLGRNEEHYPIRYSPPTHLRF
jgi:hypothetical protein